MKEIAYTPPIWQFNAHLQTIYPCLFRKINIEYTRERVELPDGDFLDLDWSFCKAKSKKLVIVTHGLEGSSRSHYVLGMIKKFNKNGWDGLAWNCRSCSGEINRLPKLYYTGEIDDLKFVVNRAIKIHHYDEIILIGFSMGGSLTLRFLGIENEDLPKEIKLSVTASVPFDVGGSVNELNKKGKKFYMRSLVSKLSKKYIENSTFKTDFKQETQQFKTFEEFDSFFTVPVAGFKNTLDFYSNVSATPYLTKIKIPTFIIQAKNDPFLSKNCLNLSQYLTNPNIHLEILNEGGHAGFMMANSDETIVEQLALDYYKNAHN